MRSTVPTALTVAASTPPATPTVATRHNGAHYLAVRDLVGSYAKRNGCGYPPRVTRIRGGERHVYPCARKELQLILNPQNHTWNRVPDASQEVWNFLSRQRL